ncbi:MAG: electron transfer flavoprotein subunit beta/FixA family protein [Bacteroidales bacterium]
MKLLVCISHVPDTETKIRISPDGRSVDLSGTTWIINPWDELGLTRAVELKKEFPETIESLTVITVGKEDTAPTLRKALALGADKAIRIDASPPDAWFVASQIAEVINRNYYDMVLTGIESSDFNGYAVGGMLAELTGYACLSNISSIDIDENRVMVQREVDGGKETLEAEVPFIAVIQKGVASASGIPSMRGIMEARKKTLEVIKPVEAGQLLEYTGYELPASKKECRLLTSEDLSGLAGRLVLEAGIA